MKRLRGLRATTAFGAAIVIVSAASWGADRKAGAWPGLPEDMPPAALAAEPRLPEPSSWRFGDHFPRTAGTSRSGGGALFWTDFIHDDVGAGNGSTTYVYPAGPAEGNGADIFRAGIGLGRVDTYWRVDWNTLVDPAVPLAVWAFDVDDNASTGATDWPANANVRSAGIEYALIVSGTRALLVDLLTQQSADVRTLGGSLEVHRDARSFVVRLPAYALPSLGTWRVRLLAGLSDGNGGLMQPSGVDATAARAFNVVFRSMAQEPASTAFNAGAQIAALSSPMRDVSAFGKQIHWSALQRRPVDPEPQPTGESIRWYVSAFEAGQGMDPLQRTSRGPAVPTPSYPFRGRVQPYAVYVPTTYDPGNAAPLTILLHGGDGWHTSFTASSGGSTVFQRMCEDRASICVAIMGRGRNTWYINEAELDLYEVWNRVAHAYAIDADRTVIGGYSMGGVGSQRQASVRPHLYAGAFIVSGAGYVASERTRDLQEDYDRIKNLGSLSVMWTTGAQDVSNGATQRALAVAVPNAIPHRYLLMDPMNHGNWANGTGWGEIRAWLSEADRVRKRNPGSIQFSWADIDQRADLGLPVDRAYWISELASADVSQRMSHVLAKSHAIAEAATAPVITTEQRTVDTRAATVVTLELQDGATPETQNVLDLELRNVGYLAVDLQRANLAVRSFVVNVSSDYGLLLSLDDVLPSARVTVNGNSVPDMDPRPRRISVPISAGTSVVRVKLPGIRGR